MDEKIEAEYEVHECPKLPKAGVQVIFDSQLNQSRRTWRLSIYMEANEEDLEENHYLENIGDLLGSTSVEIAFCPYCGKDLYDGACLHL